MQVRACAHTHIRTYHTTFFPAAQGHACQKCCFRFIQPQAARSSLRPGPPVAAALASVITYKGPLSELAETSYPGIQLSPIQVYQELTPVLIRSAVPPTQQPACRRSAFPLLTLRSPAAGCTWAPEHSPERQGPEPPSKGPGSLWDGFFQKGSSASCVSVALQLPVPLARDVESHYVSGPGSGPTAWVGFQIAGTQKPQEAASAWESRATSQASPAPSTPNTSFPTVSALLPPLCPADFTLSCIAQGGFYPSHPHILP